jgi:hypothetical protein
MRSAFSVAALTDQRQPGRLYKLSEASVGIDTQAAVSVNEGLMSATAVISTPTVDRVRDLLVPRGCQLENYKKNPVVFWDHGFSLTLPIAKSEDPNGNHTVAISDSEVMATSYFSQKMLEARQIFELIVDGIIRATSVRMTPKKSAYLYDDDDSVCKVDEWELEEWSWVGIGCNPDAIGGVVSKNRLDGKPIAEPIMKSLQLWLPPKKIIVPGATLKGTKKMAKSKKKALKEMSEEELTKALDDATEAEDAEAVAAAEEEQKRRKADDDVPADDGSEVEPEETAAGSEQQQKYGAQVLSAAHASMAEVLSSVSAALAPLENEEVKAALEAFIAGQQEQITMLEGVYSSAYGGTLKADVPTDAAEEAEMVKSFLASSAAPRFQLQGMAGRLKALLTAKNVTPEQQATVNGVMKQLASMVAKAKAHKAPPKSAPAEEDAKLQEQIDALQSKIKKLGEAVPHTVNS